MDLESVSQLDQSADQQLRHRDGTSQAARQQDALDPDHVAIDERSIKDLLAFAQQYAKELAFFVADDQQVQADGDWSAFLSSEWNLDDVIAFMSDPAHSTPDQARLFSRPHFTLFLTFLQLLGYAQQHLNTFTRRHLDFYYQQVLAMAKRPGSPDQVNVLVDLAPDTEQFRIAAGTLLHAGSDSLGQDLVYHTDQDLVVNRAQIARVSSVYADKQVTGVREALENNDVPALEAFMNTLKIALGSPQPGDPLPSPPWLPPPTKAGAEVDYASLQTMYQLVDFVRTGLFMDFPTFRTLVQLKQQRDHAEAEWATINQILTMIGRKRSGNNGFVLNTSNPRDFDTNLRLALNGTLNFNRLTQVKTIYDLYDQRIRESVQRFVHEQLYIDNLDDFFNMMRAKIRIDNEWGEIFRILQAAGQHKTQLNPDWKPPAPFPVRDPKEADAFAANLAAAIGPVTYPSIDKTAIRDIDSYDQQIRRVETWSYMSAEDFITLMNSGPRTDATPQERAGVYAILAAAHQNKVFSDRMAQLRQIREQRGFDAMIAAALGTQAPQEGQTALDRLDDYVADPNDTKFLKDIAQRTAGGNITDAEWDATYRIVASAQRALLGTPLAQKEAWINLYPAPDATAIRNDLGIEPESNPPRWKTFGQEPAAALPSAPPAPVFGWAISSPVLALSQGTRTITLTLGFDQREFEIEIINALFEKPADPTAPVDGPFQIEMSAEKGWLQAETTVITIGDYYALRGIANDPHEPLAGIQCVLTFGDHLDALAAFPAEAAPIDTPWPVLRLMLRQIWQPTLGQEATGRYITHYQPFKALVLRRTHVAVDVAGLLPAQIQNDDSVLSTNRPFEPFGSDATAGAHLYVGHPELIDKILDSLDFHVEWMGVPANLATYYKNYALAADSNFTARISLIDQRLDLTLIKEAPLFAAPDASQPQTIEIAGVPAAIAVERPKYVYERAAGRKIDDDLLLWPRYVQWELNAPDFQHGTYPALVASKSMELSAAIANKTAVNADDYKLNPPYTPKIKKLSLDYTASVELLMTPSTGVLIDQIYHVHPFGYSPCQPDPPTQQVLFLPMYNNEGELYIGIRAAFPPEDLSLFFQMAEGSANPDLVPVPVQWSYLSANRWISLDDGNQLLDTTRGLINSGIIIFALEPTQASTLLPPDLYWIRATIAQGSNSVCDTIAIHTQAVSATFTDQGNAADHLSQPLPAGSITGLTEPAPEVAALRQPYTSYGGSMPEQDQAFYTRTSERLRHKGRALTVWDYERLILERFPQVYKAKCLPASPTNLGQVDIIVIPDIVNKRPFDPFEPKAPADLLADIHAYLADRVPAYATVNLKNAHYVPVKVRFAVRFHPGANEGFYKQQLNDEINRFLSPWAYEESAEIVIGGRIYDTVLINFIESRPYVDYMAQIKLFSSEDGRTFQMAQPSGTEGYWVESLRTDGVLVAARQHEIDMIPDTGYANELFIGINYMKIELDFIVSA